MILIVIELLVVKKSVMFCKKITYKNTTKNLHLQFLLGH